MIEDEKPVKLKCSLEKDGQLHAKLLKKNLMKFKKNEVKPKKIVFEID